MFYAELNENGKVFHITDSPLEGENVMQVESMNVIGKVWNGETFVEDPADFVEPTDPVPSQLDRIEEKVNIIANGTDVVDILLGGDEDE